MALGSNLRLRLRWGNRAFWNPYAVQLFNAFTVAPVPAYKTAINNFMNGMYNAGTFQLLDVLHVYSGLSDQGTQGALLNWKMPGRFNGIANGGLTFAAKAGFTGDGSTGWIDTGYNPSTAVSIQWAQNNASFGAYRAAASSASTIVGVSGAGGQILLTANTVPSSATRLNGTTSDTTALASATGMFGLSRSASGTYGFYKDGSSIATISRASSAVPTSNLSALKSNTTFGASQVGLFFAGASLSAAQQLEIATDYQTFLTAIQSL